MTRSKKRKDLQFEYKRGINLISKALKEKKTISRKKMYSEGINLVCKAALSGNVDAQFEMGQQYEDSGYYGKKPKLAFEWYLKAAKKGHPGANNCVGFYYEHDIGFRKNRVEARKWYHRASLLGDMLGQYNLGLCYELGTGKLKKNYKKAFNLYKSSAKQGNPEAQIKIAEFYRDGIGVQKNPDRARYWAKKAGI